MTHSQCEAYKTQLARAYEVLTEARTPRQTGHRAAQLRTICTALRQVCNAYAVAFVPDTLLGCLGLVWHFPALDHC